MKRCFKCKQEKPRAEFYKHPMMGDGLLGKCKECARADVRENYEKRREQYQRYDHARYATSERQALLARSKARMSTQQRRARNQYRNAVEQGRLVRQPCEICGALPVDGHHDDYTQPLSVRWLCRKHHMRVHGQLKTARPF